MKKDLQIRLTDALIVVDVQNDFCSGGALPVPEGEQVVPVLNEYIKIFKKAGAKIVATRDWHPPNHISFKAQGGPWPSHCVQGTEGAKFHPDLKLPADATIISKATDPFKEAYSGFDGTELATLLSKANVTRVFVGGLATDYCVKTTVLDARKLGFTPVLLLDAVRGIEAHPGDVKTAIEEMSKSGAEQVTIDELLEAIDLPPASASDEELLAEKPLTKVAVKKKARMRPRGKYKRVRTEQ